MAPGQSNKRFCFTQVMLIETRTRTLQAQQEALRWHEEHYAEWPDVLVKVPLCASQSE
jgi:hypothetical protein